MIKAARLLVSNGDSPGLLGGLLLLALLSARALASATTERVYVLGYEAHWACLFRRLFALPCHGCGLTRGALLTLQGDLSAAFALNPAAPLVVFGVITLAVLLITLALFRRAREPRAADLFAQRVRQGVRLYGAALGAVLLVNWIAALLSA